MGQRALDNPVMVGTALGDATIQKTHKNGNARMRVGHSEDKKGYLDWKYNQISQIVRFSYGTIPGGKYKKSPNNYVFIQSRRTEEVTKLYEIIYKEKKKRITEEILSAVNSCALSVWFMDDGSFDKHPDSWGYWLHTNAYTRDENEMISSFLRERFGLNARLQYLKRQDQWALRFGRYETPKIADIIRPVVSKITCMRYKLPEFHGLPDKFVTQGGI